MKSPFLVLHKAIRDRIKDVTGREVYDDFPENVSMPYIVAGEIEGRDWSDKFQPGQQVIATIHIWSSYPGRKEVAEIMDETLQALSSESLSLSDEFKAVLSSLDLSQIIIDIDGMTRHGILKLRFLIEELS
jgi:hypothetical protein